MEVSGQFHVQTALSSGKEASVSNAEEFNIFCHTRESIPYSSIIQPIDW
jgi:hypothetical protein